MVDLSKDNPLHDEILEEVKKEIKDRPFEMPTKDTTPEQFIEALKGVEIISDEEEMKNPTITSDPRILKGDSQFKLMYRAEDLREIPLHEIKENVGTESEVQTFMGFIYSWLTFEHNIAREDLTTGSIMKTAAIGSLVSFIQLIGTCGYLFALDKDGVPAIAFHQENWGNVAVIVTLQYTPSLH
jgi:hypothetical protein